MTHPLATPGRPGGYSTYFRQLEYELDELELDPVDSIDTTQLRAGTHEVEIRDVAHVRGKIRVTVRGGAGRRLVHYFDRADWDSLVSEGAARGSRLRVEVGWSLGCRLARTPGGATAALDPRTGRVASVHADIDAVREAGVAVSELTLLTAEVLT